MKIVLTGGGTAGHIMPNIALLNELQKHFEEIFYIGTNGMEKTIVGEYKKIKFREITAVKLIRKLTLKNLLIPAKLLKSIKEAKKILKEIKPDVVFSKGGFVAVPVAIAAKSLKIPIITHESDITMGLANKIIYRYCSVMLTSFEITAKNKPKCICTGSPIREQLFCGKKTNINFAQDKGKPNILIFGGSLGAQAINKVIATNIDMLANQFNIIHIVGKKNLINKKFPKNYLQIEFTNHIEDYFAFADMVVTRGGSNALFELLALRKPMLIIPLPKSESRGDQLDNAKYFKDKGYAKVLLQENLTGENLLNSIKSVINNKNEFFKNAPIEMNTNKQIVKIILENIKKTP